MSTLDDILKSFTSLSGDAICVGFRGPDDDEARVMWINDAYTRLFGYTMDDVGGRFVGLINDPAYYDDFLASVKPGFEAGQRHIQAETYCRTKDGSRVWTNLLILVVPTDEGRYSIATYRDLKLFKQREKDLEHALSERDTAMGEVERVQDRLLTAMNGLEGPFAIWDEDYRLVVSNAAFAPTLINQREPLAPGTRLEDFLQMAANSGLFEDAIGNEDAWAEASIKAMRSGPISDITRFTNGRVQKAVSYKAPNGDTLVIGTDITELETARLARETYARQLEKAHGVARHQASHDSLTGLGNRRFLGEALDQLCAKRRESGGHIAVLHVDLDRFKQINDTRGHTVGDAVLRAAGKRLEELLPDTDTLTRTGGDEFVILCHRAKEDLHQASQIADEISAAFWRPLTVEGNEFRVGASVGLATTKVSEEADLLTDSDIALYKAKSAGRGRVCRFEKSDFLEMVETKALSDDLLRGLDAKEIVPYYQVQIDAKTGQPVGLEALARWLHPEKGVLTPDRFLPIAEDLEVVDRIDRAVFERAVQECGAAFLGRQAPSLSFNISHKRLMSRGVLAAARDAAAYPGQVAFELLESIFLDDQDAAITLQLDALRDAGVELEVDDFGSGHASIIALEQVAPDRLKIDRRLISPITTSPRSAGMVQAIIDLARALEIKITAEGVETKAHADMLEKLGCDRFQGYFFGRPATLDDVLEAWWPNLQKRKRALAGG